MLRKIPSNHVNVVVNGVSVGLFTKNLEDREMNEAAHSARATTEVHDTGTGKMVGHRRVPGGEFFRLDQRARMK